MSRPDEQPNARDDSWPPLRPQLRVCHIAYSFYESDNRVLRYAEALYDEGNYVDVIALRRKGQPRASSYRGVHVSRIQRREINERQRWIYFLKILAFFAKSAALVTFRHIRNNYDVIHVHNVPDFLVFTTAIARLLGARVILDIHDVLPELYAGKFGAAHESRIYRYMLLVERWSCRFADHVIIANDLWRQKLIRRAVAPEKCTTVLNYPDLQLFGPAPTSQAHQGKFVLMYPGSLNRHQGLHVALAAFLLVKDRIPEAELHIYGEGPAREDLARSIRDNGLESRVRLFKPLPIREIAQKMASADLGVEPKLAEGFSNEALSTKILEFMACGVPVVVSRTAAHGHYFADNVVQFFESGNEVDLAEKLVAVYRSRCNQADWICRARQFAHEYSWQQRAGDYRNIIASLLPQAAKGARQL